MELQFRKNTFRGLDWLAREVKQDELTQDLKLPDGMPDIGRILTAWGQVVLRGKEWRGDKAVISGGVMVWVLYAPEDGSDERCVDAWLPFSMKWDIPSTDREGTILAMPLLRFVDGRALSARKILLRAGLAARADMLCPREWDCPQPENVPEDVELLRNHYPLRLPRETGEKTFQMDEEVTLPMGMPDKILSYMVCPEITEEKVLTGKVVFRGILHLHLICRSGGEIRGVDLEMPFSQLQELEEELSGDARTGGNVAVTNLELDQEGEHLRLKCGLVCQYLVDDVVMTELVQDAYSPRRAVTAVLEDLTVPAILEERTEQISAAQEVANKTGKILDVTFLPDFPRQRRTAEGVDFELPGIYQILYAGEDGMLQGAMARWEGTYRIPAGEAASVMGTVVPAANAGGRETPNGMELYSQLRMKIQTEGNQGIPMVTALEMGELQEPDACRPSLILCRSGGEKLWNIAKACGSTVRAIQQANDISEETEPGKLLLIPTR